MKLERVANKVVAVVTANDPVDLAIQHMQRLNIRHLPVVHENTPIGMVSERDVLFHVCWLDHPESALAGERGLAASGMSRIDGIMTSPAVVLAPGDPIEKAARVMINKKISSVPLAASNQLVGIVTETDLLRCFYDDRLLVLSQACRQSCVADHMTAHIFSVRPDDATLTAIRLMREKQLRHVPVMDGEELVGIISDRDVLRGSPRSEGDYAMSANELRISHKAQALEIMSPRVEVLAVSATLAEAAERMVKDKIGALPVVHDSSELIGIVTETDLLRAFVADYQTG